MSRTESEFIPPDESEEERFNKFTTLQEIIKIFGGEFRELGDSERQ